MSIDNRHAGTHRPLGGTLAKVIFCRHRWVCLLGGQYRDDGDVRRGPRDASVASGRMLLIRPKYSLRNAVLRR